MSCCFVFEAAAWHRFWAWRSSWHSYAVGVWGRKVCGSYRAGLSPVMGSHSLRHSTIYFHLQLFFAMWIWSDRWSLALTEQLSAQISDVLFLRYHPFAHHGIVKKSPVITFSKGPSSFWFKSVQNCQQRWSNSTVIHLAKLAVLVGISDWI